MISVSISKFTKNYLVKLIFIRMSGF